MADNALPLLLTTAFLCALFVSLLGTYRVRAWAKRKGYVERPGGRRIHLEPTPNVGGIAVGLGTTVVFAIWTFLAIGDAVYRPRGAGRAEIVWMLVGGCLMLFLGVRDDIRPLSARLKFLLQWVIASLVFVGGVRILGANLGTMWIATFPGWLSYVVTTFWIVGVANAFNLIDGSDGIASGAALFASASLGVVFALNGDLLGALMATILVGACLGFLFFNFPPASIFLGDGGSLFLGYTLATLAVITTHKASTLVAVMIPVVAFGVPLLDTFITIVRRFLRREPIFRPDRGHIHHRLGELGHSPRAVLLVLYLACASFAALSLLLTDASIPSVLPVFIVAAAVLVMGVQRLKVPELAELTTVIGRGFQQRSVIAHNIQIMAGIEAIRQASDGAAVIAAFDLAFEGSEFHRLELWVPSSMSGPLMALGSKSSVRQGSGCLVRRKFSDAVLKTEVEIRVPILDEGGREGRLSLHRSGNGDRLFSDLRLLPNEMVPALAATLLRLSNQSEPSDEEALASSASVG